MLLNIDCTTETLLGWLRKIGSLPSTAIVDLVDSKGILQNIHGINTNTYGTTILQERKDYILVEIKTVKENDRVVIKPLLDNLEEHFPNIIETLQTEEELLTKQLLVLTHLKVESPRSRFINIARRLSNQSVQSGTSSKKSRRKKKTSKAKSMFV